ncbi:hypothetical protein LTR62_001219 [Meristemomyces frigidus]|uniref:M serotype protein n=1 Tax=Meristemomyces frigidus TaxID=1508187 RepID=A0AAN7YQP6_9PEZI|nr:hypothetical protein LTR62_001219 [Meristemomyces frigidus]
MSTTPKAASKVSGKESTTRPSANRTPTASSNTSAPSRSPSRMAASQPAAAAAAVNGTGSAAAVNRTRSVRNGAPVSARAAAAARKSQIENQDPVASDQKAEMQAQIDELQERLQHSEESYLSSHKQASVLQMKLDETLSEQGTLEEQVHEHTERIEELENEKKESLRARREMEQIYEEERASSIREREEAAREKEEMRAHIQRMKDRETRAGLGDDADGVGGGGAITGGRRQGVVSRTSSFRSQNASPNPQESTGAGFAPPSSAAASSGLQRSDSQSRSRLVNQKDRIIEELRLELAEMHMKLVEVENMGGGRFHQLQKEMYEIKVQNARLMEENESFQLLLTEKTMSGDFLHPGAEVSSRPPSRNPDAGPATSLAEELGSEADSLEGDGAMSEQTRKLGSEVKKLEDQNKALTLYINNIISRLLLSGNEGILDKTSDIPGRPAAKGAFARQEKELPPPPPPPHAEKGEDIDEQAPQGFLQRARSVMGGGRRGRPTSQAVGTTEQAQLASHFHVTNESHSRERPRPNENPDTAPRVPLNRSNSSRGGGGHGHGHRRTNSDWPPNAAAGVVGNMMNRGASPATLLPTGSVSPGLASPPHNRNSFFPIGGNRVVSNGITVPTISETGLAPTNARDSKGSSTTSHRSSVISNTGDPTEFGSADDPTAAAAATTSSSTPSSSPRSTTSSGEGRDSRPAGGAVMVGSKPRPLRLVQNKDELEQASKAGNRGSWFGWMGKGAAPGGVGSPPHQQAQGGGTGGYLGSVGRSVNGNGGGGGGEGQGQ